MGVFATTRVTIYIFFSPIYKEKKIELEAAVKKVEKTINKLDATIAKEKKIRDDADKAYGPDNHEASTFYELCMQNKLVVEQRLLESKAALTQFIADNSID